MKSEIKNGDIVVLIDGSDNLDPVGTIGVALCEPDLDLDPYVDVFGLKTAPHYPWFFYYPYQLRKATDEEVREAYKKLVLD